MYHWHFTPVSIYDGDNNVKKYTVTFGPFLGGLRNGIYGLYILNHGILMRKNHKYIEWIKDNYPEYSYLTTSEYDTVEIINIYRKEMNKYWDEIKKVYLEDPI